MREERYRRKTRQRAPKPPFGFRLFIRGFGGETCLLCTYSPGCNLRDLGPSVACASTLFPRTLLYCSNCGEFVGTERITGLICSRKLGGCESAINSTAARRAHGSSAEHAMRDLIASNTPLREGRHTARQNGPKHYPRGFKGIAIPLARLSPLSFAVQRKMESPKGAGNAERRVKTQKARCRHRRSPVAERGR